MKETRYTFIVAGQEFHDTTNHGQARADAYKVAKATHQPIYKVIETVETMVLCHGGLWFDKDSECATKLETFDNE